MRFEQLSDWLNWLAELHPKNIDLGLTRVTAVAQRLQLCEFSPPVMMIAGTNGKGSSIAMLNSIYQAAGYRVASMTSPHIIDFRERVQINSQLLSQQDWCQALQYVDQHRDCSLTYFEFTVLAGLYLIAQRQQQLDVIILEIGLGGRLDAVNVVQPDLSIITTIDFDHQAYLGNTREAIGREKAGIMRAHKPVICGDRQVPNSVIAHAQQLSSILFCQAREFDYDDLGNCWRWYNTDSELCDLPKPALPMQNAATVLQAINLLQARLPVASNDLRHALATVSLTGRFQRLVKPHPTILDVAHNPQASQYLADKLRQSNVCYRAVVGMLNTKDISATLSPLLAVIEHWYCAPLANQNSVSAESIVALLDNRQAITADSIRCAYQLAIADAQKHDIIVVFGSFYSVAEVLQLIAEVE